MKKVILAFLALLILVAIVFVAMSGSDTNNRTVIGDIDNWQSYTSDAMAGYQFSINYPTEAELTTEGAVRILYAGPDNEDPALTDGFALYLDIVGYAMESDLVAEAVGEVENDRFKGKKAYRFSSESELSSSANVNNLVVILDSDTAARINYSIFSDSDNLYQNTIDNMIETLSFKSVDDQINNGDNVGSSDGAARTSTVQIALLNDPASEPERGCDNVVMVDRSITSTTMPLTAAINELFTISETTIDGNRHFIPNTADTLSFDRAEVVDGVARIYLEGELSGINGVCDDPRAAIQIEETALQFSTVDEVQLYLNGLETDLIGN